MVEKSVIRFNRPSLFAPAETRNLLDFTGPGNKKNLDDLQNSNIESSASFRYDPPGTGIKNSQQLSIEWDKFENHTFFNSAEAKVNVAFDKIINEYPFDGTKKETEAFLDTLTGFEKWVFDNFPTNKGYLLFSGTQVGEDPANSFDEKLGTHIDIPDFVGSTYPTLSKKATGKSILDPEFKSFSFEMQLFVPEETNDNQIVAQKLSGSNQGFTLALSQSSSTSNCDVLFGITSASIALSASTNITKGRFNHIYAEFNRSPAINNLKLFVNEAIVASSSNIANIDLIDFTTSNFVIGSGSTQNLIGKDLLDFIPKQTLSGAIDEFRFFHSTRTAQQQKLYAQKNIFSTPELKLYYKFNEPTGSIGPNSTVLDSSGNSMHAQISNYVHTLRATGSLATPMTFEKLSSNPVLFPAFDGVQDLNADLLFSASNYDEINPNLITRLIPRHYLIEGQFDEAFENIDGTIVDSYGGENIPGSGQLGSAQLLSSFLFVWAKYFDELKLFLDHFGNTLFVNYNDEDYVPNQILPFLAKYWGLEIPGLFQNAEIEQYVDAENIQRDIGTNSLSLQFVQNQIWRRVLTNLPDIIKSKGTLYSVKALMRTLGVNPDSNFRIREFGGTKEGKMSFVREQKTEVSSLMDFSGSLASVDKSVDIIGTPLAKPHMKSGFLSGSRVEVGFPEVQGTFVNKTPNLIHGVSNNVDDGLFTSGSWTYEGIYKFPNLMTGSHFALQSLARLHTTGTSAPASSNALISNLIAVSGSATSSIKLFTRPTNETSAPTIELLLTGVNVFDGNKWNISFGRQRNDEVNSFISSSYFLRAGRNNNGRIEEIYTTSSYFMESNTADFSNNVFQNVSSGLNSSGLFIAIGSQSFDTTTTFLNDTVNVSNNEARASEFSGQVGQIKFWSKGLTNNEWKEHTRNYKSLGVENPLKNFNFERDLTGSFEKLRLDVSTDQPLTESSSNNFEIFDFSQNHHHFSGSGFEADARIIKPERFDYSYLSPNYDEAVSFNKVRARSFEQQSNIDEYNAQSAPIFDITKNQEIEDDTRFSIEFSIISALNEDIVNIFATFDELESAIGNTENMFSREYHNLEEMRKIYFNRLEEKINLKDLFAFFKWFDGYVGMTSLIEQLLPRKTKFFGVNFTIENHMLERAKKEYHSYNQYLESLREDRSLNPEALNGTIKQNK